MKLTYTDTNHAYYLDGRRCKGVTTVAKIPTDTYTLEQWSLRQVAIGLAMDRNLVENVAVDIDNRDAINALCEQAKTVASAHRAADRGTQMHRVLQLVLLDQEHRLLTEQQRRDADVLKRTLAAYQLAPYNQLTEQFVLWPEHAVAGRFDAVLEKPDGTLVLTDLKSGPNAVAYPHSTAIQLALYARAPHISDNIHSTGDRSIITDWREMPERLERRYAYVLLVPPDAEIGTLHEIDIQHGWAAGRLALEIVRWRKQYDNGRGIVREIPASPFEGVDPYMATAIAGCKTVESLRGLWNLMKNTGDLSDAFKSAAMIRFQELDTAGVP